MATVGSLVVEMGMDIARLQSDVTKASVTLDNVDKSVVRMGRSLEKLTNIYEYATSALRRMQFMLTSMAFGLVTTLIGVLTAGIMKWWQEMNNADEIGIKLRDTILNQAQAWKILPIELDKTTESTIRLYNANLKVLQLEEANKGENLRKKIENLEAYRNKLETNISFMTMFGEVIGDNTLSLAKNQAALEKARAELERWDAIQKMQPTTLGEVTNAMGKQSEELLKQQFQLDEHVEAYQKFYKELQKAESAHYIEMQKYLDILRESINLEQEAQNENMKTAMSIWEKTGAEMANIQAKQENLQLGISKQIIAEASPYAAKIMQYNEYITQLQDMQTMELDLLQSHQQAELSILMANNATQLEIEEAASMQKINLKNKETQQSMAMDKLKATVAIQTIGSLLSVTGALLMQGNKEQFEEGKKLAYAGAVVSIAHGIAQALGTAPPPLSFALAALVAAAGAIQIATISKMQYGGTGGISAPSTGGGISGGGGIGGGYSPSYQPTEQLPSQNIIINVYNPLDGRVSEEVADAIIRAINEAPNRNVTINAQAVY